MDYAIASNRSFSTQKKEGVDKQEVITKRTEYSYVL